MKKHFFIYVNILGISLIFNSCSKNPSSTSSTVNPTNPATCTFLPYRVGTKIIEINYNNDTITNEIVKDTIINKKRTFYVDNKGKKGPLNPYPLYSIDTIGNIFLTLGNNIRKVLNPKDSVGTKWEQIDTFFVNGVMSTNKTKYEVIDNKITETVNGITYNNCIKVKENNTFEMTWACGLGTVRQDKYGNNLYRTIKFIY